VQCCIHVVHVGWLLQGGWECGPVAVSGFTDTSSVTFIPSPTQHGQQQQQQQLHAVTGGFSGAAAALLMRLRTAALFEDALTRQAAVAALCAVAVRLPDPIR
jgi:hypothetical protein